jgi:hypothetical protein
VRAEIATVFLIGNSSGGDREGDGKRECENGSAVHRSHEHEKLLRFARLDTQNVWRVVYILGMEEGETEEE